MAAVTGLLYLNMQMSADGSTLSLRGQTYQTSIMQTDSERARGLSGTPSLAPNHSMLFVFPGDGKWGIWMKDMNYPIDIVWLDKNEKVTHLEKNARPSSYPDTIFTPNKDSRYVIEFANGTIERTGITIGDIARLPSEVK